MSIRLQLNRDIDRLVRIFESNRNGLRSKATSPSDRITLKLTIGVLGYKLKCVRQQRADLNAAQTRRLLH